MSKKVEIDLIKLTEYAQKPTVYSKGTHVFWQDPYIAQKLLETHLSQNTDMASKRLEIIDDEVNFIANYVGLNKAMHLIDLGCGPGLFCERFYQYSPNISGVDFSMNSIRYAQASAKKQALSIDYHHMSYLNMDFQAQFDVATMIYYDFGALLEQERHTVLDRIKCALKPGGYFIFDVLSASRLVSHQTNSSWCLETGGFWSPDTHIILENQFVYPEKKVLLNQYIVINEAGSTKLYRIYETVFSYEDIERLLKSHGFVIKAVYQDLTGQPLSGQAETMGIIACKK